MPDPDAIKVVLRAIDGRFLAGHRGSWRFIDDPKAACVFDYLADHIPEQLSNLQRNFGLVLTAVAVDPHERYEVCDRCGRHIMALKAYFDGAEYLCPACRQKTESTRSR